jgi:hypothetical protein
VITAKKKEVFWIFDLVSQQKANSLQRLLATIDIITEEEIVGLGWKAAILEQSQQIIILAVNIT